MKYTYRGGKDTAPALRGMQCDAVYHPVTGKCITSRLATMLVVDANGKRYVVLRRQLRINKEVS
jgi:hypothetical protein